MAIWQINGPTAQQPLLEYKLYLFYFLCLDTYVQDLIEAGDFDTLQKLMLDGYDHIQNVLEKLASDGQMQDTANLMTTIPEFQVCNRCFTAMINRS